MPEKLQKKKLTLEIIATATVLIMAIAGAYLYGKKDNNIPQNQDITFRFEEYVQTSDPEGGTINYPVLLSGADENTLKKINSSIQEEVSSHACFGPEDKETTSYLREDYSNRLETFEYKDITGKPLSHTPDDIKKWSYEVLKERLHEDFGYDSYASSSVTYAKNDILSFEMVYGSDCGGAHPADGMTGMTFDMNTGDEIFFSDLFTDFKRDEDVIARKIYTFLEQYTSDPEYCSYVKDWMDGVIALGETRFALKESNIALLALSYPHVARACDPADTNIPSGLLDDYLKPEILEKITK